jgi:hypothetical protein
MPLGGLITLAVLLPNLLYLVLPPVLVPPELEKKGRLPRIMEGIERVGQLGCFLIPFFYPLPTLQEAFVDALVVMGLALVFYFACWIRYAVKGHRFVLLYAPFLGIPLPMAILPVIYFAGAALLLRSWPLGLAVILLAAGHLYISRLEYSRCTIAAENSLGKKAYN